MPGAFVRPEEAILGDPEFYALLKAANKTAPSFVHADALPFVVPGQLEGMGVQKATSQHYVQYFSRADWLKDMPASWFFEFYKFMRAHCSVTDLQPLPRGFMVPLEQGSSLDRFVFFPDGFAPLMKHMTTHTRIMTFALMRNDLYALIVTDADLVLWVRILDT
jgi:hypothetical protein